MCNKRKGVVAKWGDRKVIIDSVNIRYNSDIKCKGDSTFIKEVVENVRFESLSDIKELEVCDCTCCCCFK